MPRKKPFDVMDGLKAEMGFNEAGAMPRKKPCGPCAMAAVAGLLQ